MFRTDRQTDRGTTGKHDAHLKGLGAMGEAEAELTELWEDTSFLLPPLAPCWPRLLPVLLGDCDPRLEHTEITARSKNHFFVYAKKIMFICQNVICCQK